MSEEWITIPLTYHAKKRLRERASFLFKNNKLNFNNLMVKTDFINALKNQMVIQSKVNGTSLFFVLKHKKENKKKLFIATVMTPVEWYSEAPRKYRNFNNRVLTADIQFV